MSQNLTVQIVDRMKKLEEAQQALAEQQAADLGVPISEIKTEVITSRIVRSTPTGSKNGINKVFILPKTPIPGTEELFLNGVLQIPALDYGISGKNITFNIIPDVTDVIHCSYEYSMILS